MKIARSMKPSATVKSAFFPVIRTAFAFFLVTCHLPGAHAAACRVTQTVVDSAASIQANNQNGGHVSIHIAGQATQVNKTQFASENAFTNAFNLWRQGGTTPSPKTCGGGNQSQKDCVAASRVGITSAQVCEAVDQRGNCTRTRAITPTKVGFWYAKNGSGSGGVWILNTAYPSENDDCS